MDLRKLKHDFLSAFTGSDLYVLAKDSLEKDSWLYPMDFSALLADRDYYFHPRDDQGIPYRIFKLQPRAYLPPRIAGYALANHDHCLRNNDDSSLQTFMAMADWFASFPDGLWRYNYRQGELRPGWLSCLGQGQGISVLVRAYRISGEQRYLDIAQQALAPFSVPIENGGLRSKLDGRWDFFEEYPLSKPHHTLNGFIYGLFGIMDLIQYFPGARTATGFDALVESLEANWQCWDRGCWSTYDLHKTRTGRPHYASTIYHRQHFSQMTYLGARLDNSSFTECAERWQAFYQSMPCRLRGLAGKIRFRLEERYPKR